MMRRKISVILIVVICFLLQSTLFSALSFASISPNLLDRGGFFLLVLCVEEKRECGSDFLRSINGYLLWGRFRDFILCYIC